MVTENRIRGYQRWGVGEDGGLLLNGYRISVWGVIKTLLK